jgi:hypothetical protein
MCKGIEFDRDPVKGLGMLQSLTHEEDCVKIWFHL